MHKVLILLHQVVLLVTQIIYCIVEHVTKNVQVELTKAQMIV
jgi:hypothetical protein